jgi:hypothetical protein
MRMRQAGLLPLVLAPLFGRRGRGSAPCACSITEIGLPANDHGKRAKPGHDERHESKIERVCSRVLAPPAGVILEYT